MYRPISSPNVYYNNFPSVILDVKHYIVSWAMNANRLVKKKNSAAAKQKLLQKN